MNRNFKRFVSASFDAQLAHLLSQSVISVVSECYFGWHIIQFNASTAETSYKK